MSRRSHMQRRSSYSSNRSSSASDDYTSETETEHAEYNTYSNPIRVNRTVAITVEVSTKSSSDHDKDPEPTRVRTFCYSPTSISPTEGLRGGKMQFGPDSLTPRISDYTYNPYQPTYHLGVLVNKGADLSTAMSTYDSTASHEIDMDMDCYSKEELTAEEGILNGRVENAAYRSAPNKKKIARERISREDQFRASRRGLGN
ncbi:Protein of unknown function [Pyronema omphalodes CBS 100304]|uniref:Uncharacterized protein n=1 Tax=Pyronema omphalodes (strain CBS 100304) TaxID=1076935 RepID=U4L8M2_PYROM|nr:Protein of unknown function [Pyronema omphalodes CBS 100304]